MKDELIESFSEDLYGVMEVKFRVLEVPVSIQTKRFHQATMYEEPSTNRMDLHHDRCQLDGTTKVHVG